MDTLIERSKQQLVNELILAGAKVDGTSVNCPFHDDGKASGSIYEKDGVWRFRCHAMLCGFSGDIYDVRAARTGRPLGDVLFEETHKGEIQLIKPNLPPAPPPPHQPRSRPLLLPPLPISVEPSKNGKKIYKTLEELTESIPGEVEGQYTYFDSQARMVMVIFRYRKDGKKKFLQAHKVEGGYSWGAAEKPWPLYNATMIKGTDRVVVVEGEKCVETLSRYGIHSVSSPCGAGKAGESDWSPLAGKNIILWPDNDEPGREHMEKVVSILECLSPAPVISMVEPCELGLKEKEDVADYIEQNKHLTKEKICEMLEITLSSAEPQGFSREFDLFIEDTLSGKRRAIDWPYGRLGNLTKALLPATVTILCGDPGCGKSFFLLQALAYWHSQGIPVSVYELEEDKNYHIMRVLAQRSGYSSVLDDVWVRSNEVIFRKIYGDHKPFLLDFANRITVSPDTDVSLLALVGWTEKQAQNGSRIIALDPVSVASKGKESWRDDLNFMNRIKMIARKYQCSVILVTHPKQGKRSGDMDDMAGGAAYPRLAQTVLWLQRFDSTQELNVMRMPSEDAIAMSVNSSLRLCKCRNGKGQGHRIAFRFNGKNLCFEELGLIQRTSKSQQAS